MNNSIHMVNYHKETRLFLDEVMLITVESGKKLNENGYNFKSTHYYYVITCNTKIRYFDAKEWFISFKH
jgi:hypothetical protein